MDQLHWDNGLSHDSEWYVNYTVMQGNDGHQTSKLCQLGPFPLAEVDAEYNDIRGYMGIVECYTTTRKEPDRFNPTEPRG